MLKIKSRRKIPNLIVDRPGLIRLSVPFFILLIANAITIVIVSFQCTYFVQQSQLSQPELLVIIQTLTNKIMNTLLVANCIFGVLSFLFWLIYSHRIFGPMVPIRRQIKQLTEGKYEGTITLRKHDEFKGVCEDLNQLTRALKNQRGQSLLQVLVSVGIMGVLMVTMLTVQSQQTKENRALTEKLASLDLQKVITSTLADGTVCLYHTQNRSFDSSLITAVQKPDPIDLGSSLMSQALPDSSAIATVGQAASALSNSVVVQKISLRDIDCVGCADPKLSNNFTANIQIDFDATKLTRSIKPVVSRVTLKTTGGVLKTITGCLGSGATSSSDKKLIIKEGGHCNASVPFSVGGCLSQMTVAPVAYPTCPTGFTTFNRYLENSGDASIYNGVTLIAMNAVTSCEPSDSGVLEKMNSIYIVKEGGHCNASIPFAQSGACLSQLTGAQLAFPACPSGYSAVANYIENPGAVFVSGGTTIIAINAVSACLPN